MSSSPTSVDAATEPTGPTAVLMRFEVTMLPVADVDRAKDFYQRLGCRLDIDFRPTPDTRGVQFTPPGSPASIQFGEGASFSFAYPDGNSWELQEATERLSGRV